MSKIDSKLKNTLVEDKTKIKTELPPITSKLENVIVAKYKDKLSQIKDSVTDKISGGTEVHAPGAAKSTPNVPGGPCSIE